MKKYNFMIAMLLISMLSQAQKFPQRLSPSRAHGFFMFDPLGVAFQDAKLQVVQSIKDADGNYTTQVLKELEMGQKNYVHIPKEFINEPGAAGIHYSYQLMAYNSNGDLIIDDTYEALCANCWSDLQCTWSCVGDDYAWTVAKYNGSQATLMLEHGPSSFIYMPTEFFYSTFQNWVNLNGHGYYGCSNCCCLDGHDIILASGDQNGVWMPPGTVGVRKGLGPWKDDLFKFIELAYVTIPYCSETSDNQYIAEYFNSYEVLDVPLECHPATTGGGGGVSWGNPGDCFGESVDLSDNSWIDCIEDLATELMTDDLSSGIGVGNPIEDVIISHWKDANPTQIVHFKKDEIIYANGEVLIPTLVMEPGFYNIQVVDKNGKSHFGMGECKNGLVHNTGEAQYVKTQVFPVPIENDMFNLSVEALADVNFTYTVRSFSGEVLFKESIAQASGTTKNYPINITNPEGNKFLLNILQFEDGSVSSFTTQIN